jgi:hypothetical protein
MPMPKVFKRGRPSKTEPQYVIKSVKTAHMAIHRREALRHVRAKKR